MDRKEKPEEKITPFLSRLIKLMLIVWKDNEILVTALTGSDS